LRVAQVLPSFFGDELAFMGGGDRYVYQLASALRPYCDVTFFTFGSRYREESLDGLNHVVLPTLRRANVDNVFPASLDFLSRRYDIVHCHQLRTFVTNIATIFRRAVGKPLIVTDEGGGGRSASFRWRLYKFIPAYICISEFSRRLLPADAQGRAAVVKGGLDPTRFPYDARPRSRQVVQVGRIMPHKGIDVLIEAAGTDIPVVVAGKIVNQTYYADLQRMARGKQIRFLIDAPDDAILAVYQRSSVTVTASVYRDMYGGYWPTSELLGLTLLESQSVGTPVVSTAVGGMPEYVRDGVTGFVIPPSDPLALRARLEALLNNPALVATMGSAGHAYAAQYSWDAVARQVSAVYARLLHGT
jgi:glycosyltransferase involved in cell wall biosynthesis